MDKDKLSEILAKHKRWLISSDDGERANLRSADLRFADLNSADLRSANLRSANLRSANLRDADLRSADLNSADLRSADLNSADLRFADLRSADLRFADLRFADLSFADLSRANLSDVDLSNANLTKIRKDFFSRLSLVPREVLGLYDALQRGKVDGSCYEGKCACFVGTIANIRHEHYERLTCDLHADSSSLTEKWFLGIKVGDTPSINPISLICAQWIKAWAKENNLELPEYKLISSSEFPDVFKEEQ